MAAVQSLLAAGADVNGTSSEGGRTPLYFAIQEGKADVVRLFVERGADINFATVWGTPLAYAAVTAADVAQYIRPLPEKYMDTIRLLMARGADVKRVRAKEMEEVARDGGCAVLNLLLDSGAGAGGDDYRQLLEEAARNCGAVTLKRIVAKGAKADEGTLRAAIEGGNDEVFQYLLSQGLRPGEGQEELARALGGGSVQIVKYFLGKGAKLDQGLAQAALAKAAECNYAEMSGFLLGKGASAREGQLLCKAVHVLPTEFVPGEGAKGENYSFRRAERSTADLAMSETRLAESETRLAEATEAAIQQLNDIYDSLFSEKPVAKAKRDDAAAEAKRDDAAAEARRDEAVAKASLLEANAGREIFAICRLLQRAPTRATGVRRLLDAGADVNARCSEAYYENESAYETTKYTGSLLGFAKKQYRQGNGEIVRMLEAAGARE